MALGTLGKMSATPGTPRRITANQAQPNANLSCASIMIQTLSSSTGKIYVGTSALDTSTMNGVGAVLPPPTANSIPSFSMGNPTAQAAFNAADVWFDGDSTSDGIIASIVR
jgi:hypothetical protein